MPHRFSDRLTNYPWLDASLSDFYWEAQSDQVHKSVIAWLDARYRRLFLREERPPTILILWGANGSGKTMVAKGIAKFHLLNLGCASLEFLHWPAFVDDQLNGQTMHPNWDAHLFVLGDMDGRRPIPESKSTWLLDKLSARLKYRAEELHYPTAITSNRNPLNMIDYLTKNNYGDTDDEVKQSAKTLISALERHLFASIKFEYPMKLRNQCRDEAEFIKRIRASARTKNDMRKLGFHFLEEKYNEETLWM